MVRAARVKSTLIPMTLQLRKMMQALAIRLILSQLYSR